VDVDPQTGRATAIRRISIDEAAVERLTKNHEPTQSL
jgi:hypothetical protein